MTPPPAPSSAGRWIALALVVAMGSAAIASGVWAVSARRTRWASDVKARFHQVEVARDARDAERSARRQVVRDEAIAALGSLLRAASSDPDPDEVTRLRGAAEVLERMSAEHRAPEGAMRDGPGLLATQSLFDLLPPPDHAERVAVLRDKLAVMEGVVAAPGAPDAPALAYLAYLRLHAGDRAGAVAAANLALLADPALWLGWVVRGEALHAQSDLLLGDALCSRDPSWALLARADLAEAEGDLPVARDLCREALDLGRVPARYGHADALKKRVARLEAATR